MTDDTPGDYDTTDGIKTRCRALGAGTTADALAKIEERVVEKNGGGGYILKNPDDPTEIGLMLHLTALFGAALEREYPAEVGGEGP